MTLCENCLEEVEQGVPGVPVGHDKGSQRDPWRIHRILCRPCGEALVDGHWDVLHDRYRAERTVGRPITSVTAAKHRRARRRSEES